MKFFKATKHSKSILLVTSLVVIVSCGQKGNKQIPDTQVSPPSEDLNFQAPTQPTVNYKPESQDPTVYQALPDKTVTNKDVVVTEGQLQITAKANYNSKLKSLHLTGEAEILNLNKESMFKKSFTLAGTQKVDSQLIELYEENNLQNSDATIIASANCMGLNKKDQIDCSHILIDVLVKYKGAIYRQQIETLTQNTDSGADTNTPQPVPVVVAPVTPPPTDTVEAEADTEAQKDQEDLQSEEHDGSLDGAYQGTLDIIDVEAMFNNSNAKNNSPTPAASPSPSPEPAATPAPSPTTESAAPQAATPGEAATPEVQKKKDEPSKDKLIGVEKVQTQLGVIRPINQSIGLPDAGHLRNSTSMVTKQQSLGKNAFFEVVTPGRQKHYGTYEMSELLTRAGQFMNQNYVKKAYVGNLSLAKGGKVKPHASHQIGVDADLAYPATVPGVKFPLVVRMAPRRFFTKNYSTEKTYNLFKFLFAQKDIGIDRLFVDQAIINELCSYAKKRGETSGPNRTFVQNMFQNIQHVKGHGDHFHIRIKCSKRDASCRSRIYRKMAACG